MNDLRADDNRILNLYTLANEVTQVNFAKLCNVWKKMINNTHPVGNSQDINTGRRYWIFKISQDDQKIVVVDPRNLYIVGVSQRLVADHWVVDIFDGNRAVNYIRAGDWNINWDSIRNSMMRIAENFTRDDQRTHVIRLSFFISEAARFQIVQAGLASLDNNTLKHQRQFYEGPDEVIGMDSMERRNQLRLYQNYLHPILNNYGRMCAFSKRNGFVRIGDIRRYALLPESAEYNRRFHRELVNLGILQQSQ